MCASYCACVADLPCRGAISASYSTFTVDSLCYYAFLYDKILAPDSGSNWFTAADNCMQLGGRLAAITSPTISDALATEVTNAIGDWQRRNNATLRLDGFWIGLHKDYWVWTADSK